MSKKILITTIIVLFAVIIAIGFRFLTGEDSWICVNGQWIKHGNPSASMPINGCGENNNQPPEQGDIIITSPQAGQIINSPLKVEGKTRGSWFFEAVFPVRLVDENGKEIAFAQAQAQGDWMTSDFVSFIAEFNFEQTTTASGVLIFNNDNPSGLPENSKEFRLPVRFK